MILQHFVLKDKHQPFIVEGCGFSNHRQPKSFVKFCDGLDISRKFKHEPADGVCMGLATGTRKLFADTWI